jgi:dynein intermediate chain 2
MESQYVYQKKRSDFGRHPNFSDRVAELHIDIEPNETDRENYITRNPVHIGTQAVNILSEHEVNTDRFETAIKNVLHVEGGWPKDINPTDMEATSRFRKKVEKDENYVKTIQILGERAEQIIRQNNAIDIYEEYFSEKSQTQMQQDVPRARTVNLFRDPAEQARSAVYCAWHPDGGRMLAVAYANMGFQSKSSDVNSYVWNIENSNKPEIVLKPPSSALCLEYNPKDSHIILGGLYSGQVCIWDVRKNASLPTETTSPDISHRDPCHRALWIQSKTGTDFFSSSTDGTCKWWDTRKLSEPVEELILDITKQLDLNSALGAICLEYEPTMPTKFMVGTEQGTIITCNRKAKTAQDKLAALYQSYSGPVNSLNRNPFFPKVFLTVGEWVTRVWSEDIRDSAIVTMKNDKYHLTASCWSPTRPGVFFTANTNGSLDIWDLMVKQAEPSLHVKVSESPLCALRCQDQGRSLAVGDESGNVTLLSLSDALVDLQKEEKSSCNTLFERETRREKILESKARELKLKERERNRPKAQEEEAPTDEPEDDPLAEIADELLRVLEVERKKITKLDSTFNLDV